MSITPFFHVYHKYVFIMSNISKIKISGTSYNLKDENACKVVELTQAQYDELPTTAKTSNSLFVITDATAGDLSNYYTKTETDGLLDTKLDVTAYTPTDLSNYYTKSETSGATQISTALASKADTATTYTKTETDNAITAATSTKQDTLVSGTNIKTINGETLLGEGNITIQGGGGGSSYTAGDGIDIINDVISVTGKVDTSTYNNYTAATDTALASKQTTLTAGTGISIVDNVISATGGGGSITIDPSLDSGSTNPVANSAITNAINEKQNKLTASHGITINQYSDTITLDVPIYKAKDFRSCFVGHNPNCPNIVSGQYSFAVGLNNNVTGNYSLAVGGLDSYGEGNSATTINTFAFGRGNIAKSFCSTVVGYHNSSSNKYETDFGIYNNSFSASTTFGDSGNTLFSVGNGTANNARHNAFEIRQNGDIYITKDGQDVKLQDQLGGGGSTYTAGDGIDINNDVISVTGKVDTSAITTSIASSSTDAQVPSAKAVYDQFGGLKLVKLTQSEYDALSTKDSQTLYVVTNS